MQQGKVYDVVIVGAGLGGLLCGVLLAKQGKSVCILEKNKQIGGCLQTFAHHKNVLDSCVHYIGGLGDGHTLHRILSYAGVMPMLSLKELDKDGFDKIYFGTKSIGYPLACGKENFVKQLSAYFPNEVASLQRYLDLLEEVSQAFHLYHLRNGDAAAKDAVLSISLSEALKNIVPNDILRAVLTGNALLYAGVEDHTPLYLHALVEQSYIHSSHKLVPGSSELSKALHRVLLQHGGALYKNAEVNVIGMANDKAAYAATTDGQIFRGKDFICNLHPALLQNLINSSKITPAFHKRMSTLTQTPSCFLVHALLRSKQVLHKNYNVYWHKDHNTLVKKGSINALNSFALYSSEDKQNPGYSATLSVMCYGSESMVQEWGATYRTSTHATSRGEEYESFKTAFATKILALVQQHFPEYNDAIQSVNVSTPLTFRDYTHTPQGALYGIAKDVNQTAATTVAVRTKIPNVYLTGQNVNMHGVLGVAITALATCGAMVGLDTLLHDINAAQ